MAAVATEVIGVCGRLYPSGSGLYIQGGPRKKYCEKCPEIQPADTGWPTGNGKKLSNSQACDLAQLCLAAS